tara:strand:- start:110 stop:1261 length:1152 start_codon:yes stop_codon:yes gene_type:complete
MALITTLSSTAVQNRKAETLNSQSIRKVVSVRDINLVDDTTIEFQGKRLAITKDAFKSLMKLIGMSATFAKKFESLFNAETKAKFVNQMKNAMAAQLNEITIVLSPTTKKVVGFSKNATDIISHDRFIGLAEQIIDQHGFEVTNWGTDADKGSVIINAFNPKAQFDLANLGLSNEVFTAGLTLKNSPFGGIQVMPYVNRMWCANGLTTATASDTYSLSNLNPESMENFHQHMSQLRKNGFVPTDFANTVKLATETPASLWEMERSYNNIKGMVGAQADSWIPLNDNRSAYTKAGMNPENFTSAQKKNARTDQSVWSLVNGMTHVATHAPEQLAFNMGDKESTELMVRAGNIFGKEFDLGNTIRSPFATDAHLEASEQVGALLN